MFYEAFPQCSGAPAILFLIYLQSNNRVIYDPPTFEFQNICSSYDTRWCAIKFKKRLILRKVFCFSLDFTSERVKTAICSARIYNVYLKLYMGVKKTCDVIYFTMLIRCVLKQYTLNMFVIRDVCKLNLLNIKLIWIARFRHYFTMFIYQLLEGCIFRLYEYLSIV